MPDSLKAFAVLAHLHTDIHGRSTVRRNLFRLQIAALVVLAPLAIYVWTAPILAERALSKATLQVLIADSQRNPENPRIFYYLGLRYRQSGELEKAETAFAHAAQLASEDETSWLAWASAARGNEKDEDAYRILTLFLRSHPQSAGAHYALASALSTQSGASSRLGRGERGRKVESSER